MEEETKERTSHVARGRGRRGRREAKEQAKAEDKDVNHNM